MCLYPSAKAAAVYRALDGDYTDRKRKRKIRLAGKIFILIFSNLRIVLKGQ